MTLGITGFPDYLPSAKGKALLPGMRILRRRPTGGPCCLRQARPEARSYLPRIFNKIAARLFVLVKSWMLCSSCVVEGRSIPDVTYSHGLKNREDT